MLSTVPTSFSSGSLFDNDPFPAFKTGFTTWDHFPDLFFTSQTTGPEAILGSVSDEPTQEQNNSNSGSDEPSQPDSSVIDERKRRHMISNRESARRSRMRKQKQLENLRNQVNRLRVQNRELTNRLRFVLYQCHRVTTDNDRLRSEHSVLRRKLLDMHQILMLKKLQQFSSAWPCNNVVTVMSDQTTPLIT